MILTFAALAAMAAQCAPGIDVKDLAAVARIESGYDTLVLHDNTTGKSHRPTDENQATALLRTLVRQGHSVDAGISQINSQNFSWLALTPESVFDPCQSLRAQRDHLQAFSIYNTGKINAGLQNGYVRRVVRVAQTLNEGGTSTPISPQPDLPKPHQWIEADEPSPSDARVPRQWIEDGDQPPKQEQPHEQ